MDKAPEMISGKDLDYLKDIINWNLIASKKANHYISHIQDEEVKNAINEVANMHKQQFNFILNIIKEGGQNEQ